MHTTRRLGSLALAFVGLAACDDTGPAPADTSSSDTTIACGLHGAPTADGRTCACDPGYGGATCNACADGFFLEAGRCVADSRCPASCGYGHCDLSYEPPRCACATGYTGAACDACASGFIRSGTQCLSPDDPDAPHCDHGYPSGPPTDLQCVCYQGYAGELCEDCVSGYVRAPDPFTGRADAREICVPGCAASQSLCDRHGACTADGGATCACDPGYVPDGPLGCVPTAGASCDAPAVFDLATGYAETTTVGGSARLADACTLTPGFDVALRARVFSVHVPTAQRVRFTAFGGGGTPTLSVRTTCDGTPLACGTVSGEPLELALPAGDVYLVLTTWEAFTGLVALAAEVVCPEGQVFAADLQTCVADPCPAACPLGESCHVGPAGAAVCACPPGSSRAPGTALCTPVADADGVDCATAITLAPVHDGKLILPPIDGIQTPVSSCRGGAEHRAGVTVAALALTTRSRVRVRAEGGSWGSTLAMAVRRDCERLTTETQCRNDDLMFLDSGPALVGGIFEPGGWTFVVDGRVPDQTTTLTWDVAPDPCEGAPACAPGQFAVRAIDWSRCECECPAGQRVTADGCAPDPCADRPCDSDTPGAPTRCVADSEAPDGYQCACALGLAPAPDAGTSPGGPACIPDPSAATWTVLVYESLDNNLGVGRSDVATELAGLLPASAPVHVVWLSATPSIDAAIYHVGMGAGPETVATWDHPDMGDWRTLRAFGLWGAAHYPANRYALALVNHGGGLEFSWDTGAGGTSIDLARGDLAAALGPIVQAIGTRFEVIDFAMCLMARWEVAEALRPYALSFLASPEVSYGLHGGRIPRVVGTDPTIDLAALGHAAVGAPDDPGMATAMFVESWVDLAAMTAVTTALNALADAMLAHPEACDAYERARVAGYHYSLGESDLGGFADALGAEPSLPTPIRAAAHDLSVAIAAAVYAQPARAAGLALYLPQLVWPADADPRWRQLSAQWSGPGAIWADLTTWDELVTTCLAP